MFKKILEKTKPELERTVQFFRQEVAKVRTGQASPALVEDVLVEVFSQQMPLKQLAGISCPERRQIVISPWDPSTIGAIEKALHKGSLGAAPVVEGKSLRVTLPPLTQEYRSTLVKMLSEKAEQTKQTLRKWRDEAWSQIQEGARKGDIREDDKFKGKDELQRLVDEYSKKVDELVARKKAEIET